MYDVQGSGLAGQRNAGPGVATATATALGADVETMLRVVGPELNDHELLVLPPHQREGRSFYDDDDLDAVRLARDVGIKAAFLHESKDREYLQEYAAGYVVEFAVGVSSGLTVAFLAALAKYVMARARQAVHHGLHDGPDEKVLVKLTVAQVRRSRSGVTK